MAMRRGVGIPQPAPAARYKNKKRGHPAPNTLAMFSNDGAPYFKTQVPSGDQIPHLCA